MQENEEEEEKQPAPKAPRDKDVFAGNKNLRSEDNKFRERDQDRCACLARTTVHTSEGCSV